MSSLDLAQESLLALLANLSNDGDRRNFLEWIRHTVLDEVPADFGFDSDVIDGRTRLRKIAEYTRQFVPTQVRFTSKIILTLCPKRQSNY